MLNVFNWMFYHNQPDAAYTPYIYVCVYCVYTAGTHSVCTPSTRSIKCRFFRVPGFSWSDAASRGIGKPSADRLHTCMHVMHHNQATHYQITEHTYSYSQYIPTYYQLEKNCFVRQVLVYGYKSNGRDALPAELSRPIPCPSSPSPRK